MTLRSTAVGATDVGRRRTRNEDRFAIVEPHGLYVIADGMGGHRCGATASRIAVESIVDFFAEAADDGVTSSLGGDAHPSDAVDRLLAAIHVANRAVYEQANEAAECAGMGTTVVCGLFDAAHERMLFAHMGDSRAYRIRDACMWQLTSDHSAAAAVEAVLGRGAWFQRVARNVLTRAVGAEPQGVVDLADDAARAGDQYLLCSDGLSSLLDDRQILAVVASDQDAEGKVQTLIRMANAAGGDDNVTVVLIRIDDG